MFSIEGVLMAARKTKKDESPAEANLVEGTSISRLKALEATLKHINKEFSNETGEPVIRIFGDRNLEVETISTGSLVLDELLGGGMPKGRIIEIYGPEASGKTSIALTAAGNVQKSGGTVAFIDLEHALDPRYATKLGVNMNELVSSQPENAEQTFDIVNELAASGYVDLIVIDSVAALVPKQELEGTMEQQSMALVARLMSRSIKKLVGAASKTGTTIIFINQLREKVGFVLGNPENTTGGKALKYFASQRIDVRRKGPFKVDKEIIGNEVKLKVVKNKIAPPYGENFTILTFNKGINREAEMVKVGVKYKDVLRLEGRSYFEPGAEKAFATSAPAAIQALTEDKELFERLSIKLREALKEDSSNNSEEASEETLADELDEE